MKKVKPRMICLCGGGNAVHVQAGLFSSSGFMVNVFTVFEKEAQRWGDKITVHFLEKSGEKKEVVGKINVVSSDPTAVFPEADIILCCGPSFANPIYLEAMKSYVKDGAIIGAIFGQGCFDQFAIKSFGGKEKFVGRGLRVFCLKHIPFVCRIIEYGKSARIGGKKTRLQMAVFPNTKENANGMKTLCEKLYSIPTKVLPTMLSVALVPGNQIIHPGRFYALFKDWDPLTTQYEKQTLMYEEFDDLSAEMTQNLSDEVLKIKTEIEKRCPNINLRDVKDLGTTICENYGDLVEDKSSLKSVFQTNISYKQIKTPMKKLENEKYIPDVESRVFHEDIPFGLLVLKSLAQIFNVMTPTIDKVVMWAQGIMGKKYLLEKTGEINRDEASTASFFNFGIDSVESFEEMYQ